VETKEGFLADKAQFKICLDEELQLIRYYIEGQVGEAEAFAIEDLSGKLIPGLKNPEKVNLLVFSSGFAKATPRARKIFYQNMKRPAVHKLAVVGTSRLVKAFVSFMQIASGSKKMKLFTDEQEAIRWLNE
jgi:hypothetical protein